MKFSKKDDDIREPYTLEECQSCQTQSKRKFKEGDYLFKESSDCKSCQGKLIIVKIFGESIKEK